MPLNQNHLAEVSTQEAAACGLTHCAATEKKKEFTHICHHITSAPLRNMFTPIKHNYAISVL